MIKASAVSRYRSESVSSTLRDRAIRPADLVPHAEKPMRSLIICLVLVVSPCVTSARAQDSSAAIAGRVTNQAGLPLAGAEVSVGRFAATVRSDNRGQFRLWALPPQTPIAITVRHVGYHSLTTTVTLTRGETREVDLQLAALPVPLDTMVTEAQAVRENLRRAGFYNRQRLGFGQFMTRDAIERLRAIDVWDVLERMPFVEVHRTPVPQLLVQVPGGICRPTIYLDGMRVADLESIPTEVIDGIELYRRGTEMPVEFGAQGTACGVLLLWTR